MNQKEELNRAVDKVIPQVVEEAREQQRLNRTVPISGTRYTLSLPGREIEIAYYAAKSTRAPLIVAYHGGGFLFGGSALDDELWVHVSGCLDANVASVNYRMSPEVKDYACLEDAYDSAVYLASHAQEFGFDPNQISVFGCSAGGNLAAAVALMAKQKGTLKLDNQILMYPFLDGFTDPDEKGEGSFSGLMPHVMNRLHFSPECAKDPLLSPVFAEPEQLADLPKAIIVYCEEDNLRHEAIAYGQKLKNAGVETAVFCAEKMPHGFIESGFKEVIDDFTRQFLGSNAQELVEGGLLRKTSEEAMEFVRKEFRKEFVRS